LRKTLTPQEVKVWNHLRSWRKRGFHFRRQAPRKGFIVDFVCLKYGLVIEIDGGQHNLEAHASKDGDRDRALSHAGFRVLRFWNSDVDSNLDGVLQMIDAALMESKPHPAATRTRACPSSSLIVRKSHKCDLRGGHPPLAGEG
jgi:very-short-patch-repair endonuclease